MAENRSRNRMDDTPEIRPARADVVNQAVGERSAEYDTGGGLDFVSLWSAFVERGQTGPSLIRFSFVAGEVGNGDARDSNSNTKLLDGGLAVQVQAQAANGGTMGAISRFDDEGIIFRGAGATEFVVHDQLTGKELGVAFSTIALGTAENDGFNFSYEKNAVYINGGRGNDELLGSQSNDRIEGGSGNDRITGGLGDDQLIGGAGSDVFIFADKAGEDTIQDFASGTDKIDLSALGITLASLKIEASTDSTLISVDSNRNGTADFTILLSSAVVPVSSDFVFG